MRALVLVLLPLTRPRALPWFWSVRPRENARDGPARLMGWLCRMNRSERGVGFNIGMLWSSSAGWESHRESSGLRRDMMETAALLLYVCPSFFIRDAWVVWEPNDLVVAFFFLFALRFETRDAADRRAKGVEISIDWPMKRAAAQ